MKLDVTQQLKNLDGSLLVQPGTRCTTCGHITNPEVVTLREAITASLVARDQAEGEEKFKRWALAVRVQQEDAPDLRVDELALIKKLVGKIQPPLTAGQVWVLLEGDKDEEQPD